MNKIIFTTCTLCMLCISYISSAQVNYTIKGTINGIDGKKVYLINAEANHSHAVIDSTTVSSNAFTFKGTLPKACFAYIHLRRMSIDVFLENGIINVSLNNPQKVTGTPINDILNACNEKLTPFKDELNILIKQINELEADQKDEKAALERKWDEVCYKRAVVAKECINQNLDNIVGAYLLRWHEASLSNAEISEILDKASPIMKKHEFAKRFIELQTAWKRTEIGQRYTDLKLKDPNDKEVALSNYMEKGKYVLIDFWSSWCSPCREEMSYLKAAYEKYASKGFEIVSVSIENTKENWLKTIKNLCITWPQMADLDEKGVSKIYGINYVPIILLVDPDGIIIAKDLRGEAIEKKLSELLN